MKCISLNERDTRYRRISEFLSEKGLDAVYITGAKGYDGCYCYVAGPGQKVNMDYYHILFPAKGSPTLFIGTKKRQAPLDRYLAAIDAVWIKNAVRDEEDEIAAQFEKDGVSCGKIGIIADVINVRDCMRLSKIVPEAELVDISGEFTELMRCNDELNTSLAAESIAIVEQCCEALPRIIREKRSILYVQSTVDYMMYCAGADYMYNKIVRQYRKDENRDADADAILDGDVYYAEITACYGGFWIQRVVDFCIGELNEEYAGLFSACRKARLAGEKVLKSGADTADVLKAMYASIHADGLLAPDDFTCLPAAHLAGMKIDMGTFSVDAPFAVEDGMATILHATAKNPVTGHSLFGPGNAYIQVNGLPVRLSDSQEELYVFD